MSLVCAFYSINRFAKLSFEGISSTFHFNIRNQFKNTMSDVDSGKQERNLNNSGLFVQVKPTQWPIIYSPEYNIGFLGLEKLHPFDAGKWGKIFNFLKEERMVRDDTIVTPMEATEEDLMVVHPRAYINSLKHSINVAGITEIWPVALLPNFVVQKKVLRPFRFQTGGTVLGGKLAMERGWAINLGGGFHHCSRDRGGGFCAYADITLTIKCLLNSGVEKVMIVDLDCHQGNGHERDFMKEKRVYIMDVYNRNIYPHDGYAKKGICRKVEINHFTQDEEYLDLVEKNLEEALEEFNPNFVVYNAGTDILDGDPLGNISVSSQGIIKRDEIVFSKVRGRNIPILMLTSGGYLRETAQIIANSILNLRHLGLISCQEAEEAPPPEKGFQGLMKRLNVSGQSSSNGNNHISRSQSEGYIQRFSRWTGFSSSSSQSLSSNDDSQNYPESKKDDL